MKNELPLSGSLGEYSLPEILLFFHKQDRTGVLTLEQGEAKKCIYIENGEIVFAASNQEEDRLGEKLLHDRKLTRRQLDESLRLSKQKSKRHGSTLLELGYIIPKDLFLELKNQFTEIVCSLFTWEKGTFNFEENHPFNEIVKLKMDIKNLIREGNKRRKSKERDEAESVSQEADEILRTIQSADYYDILGVDYKSSLSDVKKVYLKLVHRYHPDRYRYLSDPSLDDKLTRLFGYFNRAYQTLGNERERELYDNNILKKAFVKIQNKDVIKVEEQLRYGISEYNKGNFWGAADYFRWVTKQSPDKAAYWAHLSLALSRIPRKIKEAEEAINKAIQLEAHNASYHVQLGLIYLKAGLRIRAEKQFAVALEWDPTNEKALKELQRLNLNKNI